LAAKARYLRATARRLSNDPKADADYAFALRLLNEIKSEAGNENILRRSDFAEMYEACSRAGASA